ncbi:antibiotic biosynthesis monooxygenase [Pseudarthrobacter sp. CCNWLW207]
MIYRFVNHASLVAWETSSARRRCLAQGEDLVEERRVEKLTEVEGWFDSAQKTQQVRDGLASQAPRPPRWKQTVSVWLAFFPVSLIFGLLIEAIFPDWSEFGTITKVFLTTTILTPVMTVWVLPLITRILQSWLTAAVGKENTTL